MRHKFLGIGAAGYHPWRKIETVISGLRYAVLYDWSVTYKLFVSVVVLAVAFYPAFDWLRRRLGGR
mgnify:CR=1 FL=1